MSKKIKTKQSIAKRFTVTKNKKVIKRTCGQDHFNARDTGRMKRLKRSDNQLAKSDRRNVRRLMPYN